MRICRTPMYRANRMVELEVSSHQLILFLGIPCLYFPWQQNKYRIATCSLREVHARWSVSRCYMRWCLSACADYEEHRRLGARHVFRALVFVRLEHEAPSLRRSANNHAPSVEHTDVCLSHAGFIAHTCCLVVVRSCTTKRRRLDPFRLDPFRLLSGPAALLYLETNAERRVETKSWSQSRLTLRNPYIS